MPAVDRSLLDGYLGQTIGAICPHGYSDAGFNHCAHVVCHLTQLLANTSTSCKLMAPATGVNQQRSGVCIRVHELFAHCPKAGVVDLDKAEPFANAQFVFVTAVANVKLGTQTMVNAPKKHVGIGLGNQVWHYSNSQHKVICQPAKDFIQHYRKQTNGLWWGDLPDEAKPLPFGGSA